MCLACVFLCSLDSSCVPCSVVLCCVVLCVLSSLVLCWLSCPALSLACLVSSLSCILLSYIAVSWYVLSRMLSCHFVSCRVLSCWVLSLLVLHCLTLGSRVLCVCHVLSHVVLTGIVSFASTRCSTTPYSVRHRNTWKRAENAPLHPYTSVYTTQRKKNANWHNARTRNWTVYLLKEVRQSQRTHKNVISNMVTCVLHRRILCLYSVFVFVVVNHKPSTISMAIY